MADFAKTLNPPRFIKTHMPLKTMRETLEKQPKVKVILSLRNPKDTLVSYKNHLSSDKLLGAFNGTWDQFFELVKQKKLPWGDYFEHIRDWYKFNKDRENSLVLKYEDMKKDHRGHVIKIAKFMGYNLSEKSVDFVVENSSIGSMRKKWESKNPSWKEGSSFVRKAQVGDWLNHFSEEQSWWVDDQATRHLEPLGLTFQYKM